MNQTTLADHRRLRRIVVGALGGVLLVTTGYGAAGLIGGAIASNAAWRPPANGVLIYVESNGIHVGLLMPKVAAGVDWRGWAPARDLADLRYARFDHVAIGWGEHAFFLETPTWSSVRPGTIAAAAIGSDRTLMHVEHVAAPAPGGPDVRAIVLRPAEYRRLAAYVQASFAPQRRPIAAMPATTPSTPRGGITARSTPATPGRATPCAMPASASAAGPRSRSP